MATRRAEHMDLSSFSWRCPSCGSLNDPWSRFCKSCGRQRPDLLKCEKGHLNPPFFNYCTVCGLPLKPVEPLHEERGKPLDVEHLRSLYVGRAVSVAPAGAQLYPLPGEIRVGEYTCRAFLGSGGFSATLLAVDHRGVNHVLKIPKDYYEKLILGQRPTFLPLEVERQRKMLRKELEALEKVSRLNHLCIVKFEDAVEPSQDTPLALVFEYCEGGSLRNILSRGPLNPLEAAEILVQIADALAKIHELGYLHLDVKPENILFSRDRIPRLADFGSSRAISSYTRSLISFTPGYAAPEVLKGERRPESDVWSLAVVLYEAVTGRLPLPEDELEHQTKIAELEAGGKLEIKTGDKELDEIIEKCLAVDPEKRPKMEEVRDMLLQYLWKRAGRS
ncbi:MAG: serine/threonine-protein kinase [Infirmifilum sp.]